MRNVHRSGSRPEVSLSFILLCIFASVLWLAGGASRADALGQVVVRGGAVAVLIAAILFGERPAAFRLRPVALLLTATALLPLLQLIPLPPAAWQALPGRAMIVAAAAGGDQPWRPWSMVPGATANAAASLLVPIAVLALMSGLTKADQHRLPTLLLCLITAGMLAGLLQFSGVELRHPLINETPGGVAGNFANRNHFALFLAFGCLVAPVWAYLDGRGSLWRGPAAFGLILLFSLTILASGSRVGMILGVLALGMGMLLAREGIRGALRGYPRWVFSALIAGIFGIVVLLVLVSVAADRAVSIDRALIVDVGQDMRRRGLPIVVAAVRFYLPFGSGLGGFDPIFRIHEPLELLKPTYFNHAHNDFLEIALDAGAPGIALLATAMAWWTWKSAGAWRAGRSMRHSIPKLGSAMILLVLVASIFDYPARTPMVMAIIVVAAGWLARREGEPSASPLPTAEHHL